MTRELDEHRLSDRERKNLSILDAIKRYGPISRTDISKLIKLNIVTVSNYVNHFIKQGLV
ncbi:MAG: winged helix-turn-helix transcriptional regulator, partial [Candidatus Omnitrophica bacterium]|nr:winged helix-turn-helix transcriptional regulator [Candidatus Omnitrophota bacterium]